MARTLPIVSGEADTEPLGLADLEERLRAAEPSAYLVSPRILRRVIKEHSEFAGLGLRVPHRKTYVIDRGELLAIADREELDLPSVGPLPERLILLARPSQESLSESDAAETLVKFWRQLFHARIHLALDQRLAKGRLAPTIVQSRIQQIGEIEFDEIRSVLRQEDYLLPPRSDLTVYLEFVAVYLELRYFVPGFVASYFPAIQDVHHIDELVKQDVDADSLFVATRLAGALDPDETNEAARNERLPSGDRVDEAQGIHSQRRLPANERSQVLYAALMSKADQVSQLGNQVRAAILRTRAARYSKGDTAHAAREKARDELVRLTHRLQDALTFSNKEADEWIRSLASLLEQSTRAMWTAEGRMLYDLQKVCVDHERGVYALDVIGWLTSLGRKPIKRYLPGQRDVLMSKHLRSAANRLPSARISLRARKRLTALLEAAVHRAEFSLRARFRPAIERALDHVKLLPQNPPERVARNKLVDELLDRIVERGFLSMGDLRDALSRNNLKLPDLASARQFFAGDQLLQADRRLADSLDGVYRGGEIYLRGPQRLSSLAFGTSAGRFLTKYVVLPFGGAFLILEGVQHLIAMIVGFASGEAAIEPHAAHHHTWPNPVALVVLGSLLLGLLHYPRFRATCVTALRATGKFLRRVFVDLPRWIASLPIVDRVLHSWPYRLLRRYLLRPFVISLLPLLGWAFGYELSLRNWFVVFVCVNLALNSRIGRNVDEMVSDWFVVTWHRIRIHVFAALFRLIMDVFNRILENIERLLYTVDEWLRFRAGERTSATIAKAVLGVIWFFVNYVIRFCVNLLVEPQINPIKHFPVVTVSHKLLLPLTPALAGALSGPLGTAWGLTVAGTIILLTPGMFGFLVWELKENWRLYAANRPRDLQPAAIGHHGETMIQFLRPGFRSGTLPKLYAKLRRANRKAHETRNTKACDKYRKALNEAAETIARFVDRELLSLLHESRSWADCSITAGEIRLGTNRILIELYCPQLAENSMWLAFEEQSGWLMASVYQRGWSDALSSVRRHTLSSALAGFYKMAGVDLVREQIEAHLQAGSRGYAIEDSSLAVWSGRGDKHSFTLRNAETADEQVAPLPARDERPRWVFSATPISWRRWVVTWELEQLGGIAKHQVLDTACLVPN